MGEINVSRVQWFGKKDRDRSQYASKEEFVSVLESQRINLQRLALLLTENSEAANRCFLLALRECIASSSVSKGWVLTRTHRALTRNAIKLVIGSGRQSFIETIGDAEKELSALAAEDSPGIIAGSQPILDFPELDRLAFVVCVLECHSTDDCALLTGRPPSEVYEDCQRAANLINEPVKESRIQ